VKHSLSAIAWDATMPDSFVVTRKNGEQFIWPVDGTDRRVLAKVIIRHVRSVQRKADHAEYRRRLVMPWLWGQR
jgi:hypothetical protein